MSMRLGPAFLACHSEPARRGKAAHLRWQAIVTRVYDLLLNDPLLDDADRAVLWVASGPLRRGGVCPVHWVYQAPAAWTHRRGLYRLRGARVKEVRRLSDYARLRDDCVSLDEARRRYWPQHRTVTALVRGCLSALGPDTVPEHRSVLLAACWVTEDPASDRDPRMMRVQGRLRRVLETLPDRHMFTWIVLHYETGGRAWCFGRLRED